MGRSRRKQTQTDTPLFDEAMAQISREHPMTEAEMQASIDRMRTQNTLPDRQQWEAIKQQVEAELRRTLRKHRT